MKKLLNFLFLIITLFLNSCGSDNNPQPTQSTKQCRLLEINVTGGYPRKAIYTYDSNKTLKSIKTIYGNIDNVIIQTFQTNAQNQIIKTSNWDTTGIERSYILIEYNSAGKISKQTFFTNQNNSFVINWYSIYQYDLNNELIREDIHDLNQSYYKTYTYGVLTKQVKLYSSSGTLELSEEFEYTNKIIPISKGTVVSPTFDRFSGYSLIKYTTFIIPGANLPPPSFTQSYQYNSEGYPQQIVKTTQGFSYPEIITYSWECQ